MLVLQYRLCAAAFDEFKSFFPDDFPVTENGLDPLPEKSHMEWFGQVIVRPQAQAVELFGFF